MEKDDLDRLVHAMAQWRMLARRRVVSRIALERTGSPLAIADVDAIDAVNIVAQEGEVTVGAVAEAMAVDPSRGSRVVAELVDQGILRRAVSQADARRSVVELTESTRDFLKQKAVVHRDIVGAITRDWPPQDVEKFSTMLKRFVDGLEDTARKAGI